MDKRSAIFIALSFAILIIMLYLIGIDNIINTLKTAGLKLIVLAIAIHFATFFLYTVRWKILNSLVGINVGLKSLFPIVMVGLAVNNITPSGRGGGEPVRHVSSQPSMTITLRTLSQPSLQTGCSILFRSLFLLQ